MPRSSSPATSRALQTHYQLRLPPLAKPLPTTYYEPIEIMKRRFFYGLLVLVLGLNLFVGAQIYLYSAQAGDKDEAYSNLHLFSYVLDRVRQEYVDGDKVSYHDLIYGALKGMVNTLDPHSEFMEPVKFTEMKNDTEGGYGGVGLVIGLKTNA